VKALELTGEWADVRDPDVLARLNARKLEGRRIACRFPSATGAVDLQCLQSNWFLRLLQEFFKTRVAAQPIPFGI